MCVISYRRRLFLYMKINMFTFSANKLERFLSTLFLAVLNMRSTGALVAGIQNSFRTPISRAGYLGILDFHHFNGSSVAAITGSARELLNCALTSEVVLPYSPVSLIEVEGTCVKIENISKWLVLGRLH